MSTPITTLAYTDDGSTIVDAVNENTLRRHAWNVVTLTDDYTVDAADGGTLFRLDTTTNVVDVALPARAGLYVGWVVRFVVIDETNGANISPDTSSIYGGPSVTPSAHLDLDTLFHFVEVTWTGTEWAVTAWIIPAP